MKEQKSIHYTFSYLILIFFIFSFIGWVWEVAFHIAIDGAFINRGVFYGPWLPIYGSGGIVMVLLAVKLKSHPLRLCGSIMAVSAVLEYITSVALERMTGNRWWDYSEYLFNFQGRVCLYGLLVFGIGGCLIIYRVMPGLEKKIENIPVQIRRGICMALVILFFIDAMMVMKNPNQGAGISIAAMRYFLNLFGGF